MKRPDIKDYIDSEGLQQNVLYSIDLDLYIEFLLKYIQELVNRIDSLESRKEDPELRKKIEDVFSSQDHYSFNAAHIDQILSLFPEKEIKFPGDEEIIKIVETSAQLTGSCYRKALDSCLILKEQIKLINSIKS